MDPSDLEAYNRLAHLSAATGRTLDGTWKSNVDAMEELLRQLEENQLIFAKAKVESEARLLAQVEALKSQIAELEQEILRTKSSSSDT